MIETTNNEESFDDVFNFQNQYESLRKPSAETIEPFVFHVNHKKLLKEEISDGTLIPKYKREEREFNPREAEDDPGNYFVFFASGTIDELSKFLAGYALVSKVWDWKASDFKRINDSKFPGSVSLAISTKNDTRPDPSGGHDMMTLYSPEGNGEKVDIFVSNQAVSVKVIDIPTTVLTAEQIEELREEGRKIYRDGQFDGGNIWFEFNETEDNVADLYAFSKHQELAIKYQLLKLKANPKLLTSS